MGDLHHHNPSEAAVLNYVLRLADSQLVLCQRLGEWAGHGPVLEEDIALTNIALDHIGCARLLYQLAAQLNSSTSGEKKTEDDLAYWRDAREFLNYTLCELPNSGIEKGQHARDYAFTITRNLLWSAFCVELWGALAHSTHADLAAIAEKSVKEARYHLRHASDWFVKLSDGTTESHTRMQNALDALLPYLHECFVDDASETLLAAQGIAVQGSRLMPNWCARIDTLCQQATLRTPNFAQLFAPDAFVTQGKLGLHSEHLGFLLAEMQSLARAHAGAVW